MCFTDPARDWSWRIRYTAVQGLVGICGHLSGNKMADGLYNIAWRSLLEANSFERDERVLEALKVGQVRQTSLYEQDIFKNDKLILVA